MIKQLESWIYAEDYRTWIGHGLQGVAWAFAFDLGGVNIHWANAVCTYHFGIREYNDYFGVANKDRSTKKKIDGVMDFISPYIGIALYALIT